MKVSKSISKVQNTITVLTAKDDKTSFDFVRLANATQKLEDKSASKLYKVVTSHELASDILGKSTMPSFKAFAAQLPKKEFYSTYDAFMTLRKFNKVEKQQRKTARQNKKTAAK